MQNVVFDFLMPLITKKPYIFFGLAALPFIFKDRQKTILVLCLCAAGLAVGDASANILKHTFERLRPCQSLDSVRLLVGCGGSFSFPSNHSVNAFVIAAVFSHFFRKAAVPMFGIAAVVALSRVYVGVHYPSDVLAGAVWAGLVAGVIVIVHKWSSERYREKPYTTVLMLFIFVLTLFRYYYLATGPIGLSPDEAHYWEWSRRLDLSYYSKGPVIAYLIAFSTWLIGDTVFGVRLFAPIFLALSSFIIYRLSMDLFNDAKKACAAALIFQITPLFAVFGVLMTIDSPFIFLWTLSIYLFWKAINNRAEEQKSISAEVKTSELQHCSSSALTYWLLLGITIGLGLLTKYTMAFFYLCAFLFIVSSGENRYWLKRKEPYLAFILSILVFIPVILWNADHGWVTFKHTAGQAHIKEGLRISAKGFLEFIGSQIGVITPLLFFVVIYGAVKSFVSRPSSIVSRYLFWFWAPVLGFFILKSFQGKVQGNWAMPAYVTAFIASAAFFLKEDKIKKSIKILLSVTVFIALLVTAAAHYPVDLNLPVKMDPTSRLRGWEKLGIKAGDIYNEMVSTGSREVFVFSDKYQVSSELAFYMPGKPATYNVDLGRRMNQYDIWGGLNSLLGHDAIFVRIGDKKLKDKLKNSFDSCIKEKFIVRENDRILRKYSIFKCYDFKGLELKEAESY